ncbi:hypothetical protein [Paraburkholderia sp. 35.1]|uniref:hypothetical protein n=1 Tax=Paraburkholderia sp. 35.1 TaxID=2991058 RepID=UPI003D2528F2
MKTMPNIARTLAALSVAGVAASAHANYVDLVNDTDQTILEFHVRHAGGRGPGPDILIAPPILFSGSHALIDVHDENPWHCLFNFTTVMNDGQIAHERNVNVCGDPIVYTVYSR